MTLSSSSGQSANGSVALDRSPAAVKVDNLLRQALKVSDPYDAAQIAKGLRDRYAGDAGQLERERMGLPAVRGIIDVPSVTTVQQGPAAIEVQTALDELEIDLREVLTDSATKDIHAEMQGWARAIRSAASDGLGSARLALDPHQRDRAFSARRSLSEYARLSRYVGALSGGNSPLFRRLAQSCDLVANLVLVGCGEALAGGGVVRSSFILQAPVSELQVRRDAALGALRNLVGSTQYAHGPNEWPRGLESYRRLMEMLDAAGQSDLRALFNEANLGRIFDELIDMASGSTADGLRALGATAMVSLGRINRLIAFANRAAFQIGGVTGAVRPESPPLAAFLSALRLFVEGFEGANRGYRLVYVARPPILTYGLYGGQGIDVQTQRLLNLILARNTLAENIDCFARCDCDIVTVRRLLRLDKILFDVDRAIDFYALTGAVAGEQGEIRALAFGALTAGFQMLEGHVGLVDAQLADIARQLGWDDDVPVLETELLEILDANRVALHLPPAEDAVRAAADAVVASAAATAAQDAFDEAENVHADWPDCVQAAVDQSEVSATGAGYGAFAPAFRAETRATFQQRQLFGELLHQELGLQRALEVQWEGLVRALTPRCITPQLLPLHEDSTVIVMLERTHQLIADATGVQRIDVPIDIAIPPHYETALDTIANDVLNDGFGRI